MIDLHSFTTDRYGIGLGLTSSFFGENSRMNASNVSLGFAFYILQIITGKNTNDNSFSVS